MKSEKVDVDQKVKVIIGKINDFKGSIHSLEVKISNLKLQDIPDETPVELKKYTHEELEEGNVAEIEKELQAAETHLRIAKPNLNAIEVNIFHICSLKGVNYYILWDYFSLQCLG